MIRKAIIKILVYIQLLVSALFSILFGIMFIKRLYLPYNEQGRYLDVDEGVIYTKDAIIAFGLLFIIAIVFCIVALAILNLKLKAKKPI